MAQVRVKAYSYRRRGKLIHVRPHVRVSWRHVGPRLVRPPRPKPRFNARDLSRRQDRWHRDEQRRLKRLLQHATREDRRLLGTST